MAHSRWSLSAESITAGTALITALIALGIGVWENVEMRRHNRLSVAPSLTFMAELQSAESDTLDEATIRLVNEGVGPAIVDEIRISLRDDEQDHPVYHSWEDARPALEQFFDFSMTGRSEIGPGTVLSIGRTLDLVTFETPRGQHSKPSQSFQSLLDALSITIEYHSIYEDEFRATFNE